MSEAETKKNWGKAVPAAVFIEQNKNIEKPEAQPTYRLMIMDKELNHTVCINAQNKTRS